MDGVMRWIKGWKEWLIEAEKEGWDRQIERRKGYYGKDGGKLRKDG